MVLSECFILNNNYSTTIWVPWKLPVLLDALTNNTKLSIPFLDFEFEVELFVF